MEAIKENDWKRYRERKGESSLRLMAIKKEKFHLNDLLWQVIGWILCLVRYLQSSLTT